MDHRTHPAVRENHNPWKITIFAYGGAPIRENMIFRMQVLTSPARENKILKKNQINGNPNSLFRHSAPLARPPPSPNPAGPPPRARWRSPEIERGGGTLPPRHESGKERRGLAVWRWRCRSSRRSTSSSAAGRCATSTPFAVAPLRHPMEESACRLAVEGGRRHLPVLPPHAGWPLARPAGQRLSTPWRRPSGGEKREVRRRGERSEREKRRG